mgnify:CR=1 FL=1
MAAVFLKLLNLSISASWLVLAVLVLRLVSKRSPKWMNVLLWGIVALRLMLPFSIESALSLIPSAETVSPAVVQFDPAPTITSGVGVFEQLHVKDVLAFLRLCVDPTSELSFLRLVELLPGVGETSARKYWRNLGGSFDATNPKARADLDALMCARGKEGWGKIAQAFARAPEHLAAHEDRR